LWLGELIHATRTFLYGIARLDHLGCWKTDLIGSEISAGEEAFYEED
jgi:hypothetical protein